MLGVLRIARVVRLCLRLNKRIVLDLPLCGGQTKDTDNSKQNMNLYLYPGWLRNDFGFDVLFGDPVWIVICMDE